MLFYGFKAHFVCASNSVLSEAFDEGMERVKELIDMVNKSVGHRAMKNDMALFICYVRKNMMHFSAAVNSENRITAKQMHDCVFSKLATELGIQEVSLTQFKEITNNDFLELIKDAYAFVGTYHDSCEFSRNNHMDYDIWWFQWREELCPSVRLPYKMALKYAHDMMADKSFLEELDRIYSKENCRKFYGHPVHYKICVGSSDESERMINLLVTALYTNHRLPGRRITYISEIQESSREVREIHNLISHAGSTTVVVELKGSDMEEHENYAVDYAETIEGLQALFKRYRREVLFIFVVNTKNPGFSKGMINLLENEAKLIDISYSAGNKEQATAIMREWLAKNYRGDMSAEKVAQYLKEQESYTYADLQDAYRKIEQDVLTSQIYPAYKKTESIYVGGDIDHRSAYKKLMDMVGVNDVKKIVNQIIAMHKMQKMRMKTGLKKQNASLHMIFTGTPGTAKTTVARLLAEILKAERLVESGSFVECGRVDLVGKYVGWTAKTVKDKFKEANGGILFIDEAYALVDDSHSFAEEAINTIVQEMENNRNDVIVIFAGYPEKMERFLNKNEGLRSRIAFHLDFPDYSPKELDKILELLAKERDATMSDGARAKAHDVFEHVVSQPEFGNGRFVRNLLEQAMLNQALRITECKGEVSRQDMQMLIAEDFDVKIVDLYKKKSAHTVGFCIGR